MTGETREVARWALILLNENEWEWGVPARREGHTHSLVLISCSGFGYRSPRAENTQFCQGIAKRAGTRGGRSDDS